MSIFDTLFGKAKDIIEGGKDVVYMKPETPTPRPFKLSEATPSLTALRNTIPAKPVFGVPKAPLPNLIVGKTQESTTPYLADRPVGGKLVIPAVIQSIVQETARGAVASGTYAGGRVAGATPEQARKLEFVPDTMFEKAIFGDRGGISVKSEAIDPLIQFGASEQAANKYGAPLLFALTAADAITGGGKKKLAKEALIAANNPRSARTVIKNFGISDEIIDGLKLEDQVINIKSTAEAEDFIQQINDSIEIARGAVKNSPTVKTINQFADIANGTSKLDNAEKILVREQAQNLADRLVEAGKITKEQSVMGEKPLANLLRKEMDKSIASLTSKKRPISPLKTVEKSKVKPESVSSVNNTTEKGIIQTALDNLKDPKKRQSGFINFGTDIKKEIPSDEIFKDAVANTPGAKITEDGLLIKGLRFQTPEQSGGAAIRTGVFYLPDEKAVAGKFYKGGNGYGGSEKMTGDILVQKPLFVKGATGGKAPEMAYDLVEGKGAYQKMRSDVLHEVTGYNKQQWQIEEGFYRLSEKYNIDESLIYDIIEHSKKGNTLPYAVQEHIVAMTVRDAGYDSILGYSKKRDGSHFLSELFDLRESTFPTGSNRAGDLNPKFEQVTKPKGILQTFKDMTPAEKQGGFALAKPKEFPKKVMPIDRLIAENKVRVRMIDGTDTYEVKKGDTWKKVRDEDSAVKQATPKKFSSLISKAAEVKGGDLNSEYLGKNILPQKRSSQAAKIKQQLPDELEQKILEVDLAKEALANDPASELVKYKATRGEFKGGLPEESKAGGFGLDTRVADAGFDTIEDARKAVDDYSVRKAEILAQEKAVKEEIKAYKATEKLKEKTVVAEKTVDRVREIQKVTPEQVRSLEEASQQINEILDLPPRQTPVSLTEIVTQQTPVTKKVNLLDYIRTPDRVLNKIGFGKEARLLRNQYEKYVIELPKNMEVIDGWIKRASDKGASQRIFDFLDGKPVQLSKVEGEVAEEMRTYLKNWADRLGLPEDNRVTNYITHLFDAELIAKEFDEDLAKIIADKIPGEVYNPFLQKRLGAKGYKRDVWGALDAYTKRATRKVHIDPVLERIREKAGSTLEYSHLEETQFKYIQEYINRVQMRPTYVDNLIDNGVKSLFGYRLGQRPVAAVSRTLRQFTYRGMLGANLGSALRNLSQGINTYAVLGEKYTAIGYAKLFSTNAKKELAEHGVLAANFIEDRTLSSTKKLLQKADKGLWYFFDNAEKINRGAAYFGAKAKGLNKGMTEVQAVEYAKSIVRKTQFAYDAVDAPVVLGSDLAKTLFQFQTFTTKQTEFLTELAKDKNYMGIVRYALAGYVFVNTVGQAMGMEEKELLPFYRFGVPPSLKLPAEIVKAAVDAPDKYGNVPDTEQKLKNIGKSTFGLIPGGIQAKKTYEGTQAVKEGGVFDKAGRQQFEQGTSTSSKVQSVLFGKYASQQAKDYFDKEINTGSKELDKALEAEKKANAETNKQVAVLTKEIQSLPKDQAKARMLEIAKTDEKLAEKILDNLEEASLGLTSKDKAIKSLGVQNGARADYIIGQINKLNTKEEKKAYLLELSNKKILTDDVLDQVLDKLEEPQTKPLSKEERTKVETIGAYGKAFFIDPSNAWKALTTREQLGKVQGNLVEMKRFYGEDYRAEAGSEAYVYEQLKKMNISPEDRSNYNLEHIVPVSAGGDSSPENLRVIPRDVHNSYTKFDTELGNRVKSGEITRKEAEKLAREYKASVI